MPTRRGSIKLFQLFGINVYVHWAWFIAFYYFTTRPHPYSNYGWNALEVLALFTIVLTHEFGHQLACRQVGGSTYDIVLWPLGGVAYVNPPQRAGAQLWSIVAGPMVNALLIPLLTALTALSEHLGWPVTNPNAHELLRSVYVINIVLLVFNLIPVYPLDGGQILRSLLWYVLGRANSLLAASIIGFIGVGGLFLVAILARSIWMGIMAGFVLISCWGGLVQARRLGKMSKIPRREGFACPSCQTAPPVGSIWRCVQCGNQFDIFATNEVCPNCGVEYNLIQCMDCGNRSPISKWKPPQR